MFATLSLIAGSTNAATIELKGTDFDYWCTGACNKDVTPATKPLVVLMGGGTDVDAAFKLQIEHSGNGDFLVLRTSGTDGYNDYVYGLGKVNSVSTLLLKNKKASSDPFVLSKINTSEAIFFAGGDQSVYVTYWQDTPLNDALNALANRGVPFGGTSAGCAIEGQYIYSALNDSVTSPDALNDPYNYRVTLGKQLLPFHILSHAITDTHFKTRDRMGRLVTFVARLIKDKWDSKPYGIGVDEKTAICIEADGKAITLGTGTAYIVMPKTGPSVCSEHTPLTFEQIVVAKLDGSRKDTFDFASMKGGVTYGLDVRKGVFLQKDPYSG